MNEVHKAATENGEQEVSRNRDELKRHTGVAPGKQRRRTMARETLSADHDKLLYSLYTRMHG